MHHKRLQKRREKDPNKVYPEHLRCRPAIYVLAYPRIYFQDASSLQLCMCTERLQERFIPARTGIPVYPWLPVGAASRVQ